MIATTQNLLNSEDKSKNNVEKHAWDTKNWKPIAIDQLPTQLRLDERESSQFFEADGYCFALVTVPSDVEVDRRKRLTSVNPEWHLQQATRAEDTKDYYAVRFHLQQIVHLYTNDSVVRDRLDSAERKLED